MNDYLVYTTSEEPDPGAEAVLYTVANGSRDVESVAAFDCFCLRISLDELECDRLNVPVLKLGLHILVYLIW